MSRFVSNIITIIFSGCVVSLLMYVYGSATIFNKPQPKISSVGEIKSKFVDRRKDENSDSASTTQVLDDECHCRLIRNAPIHRKSTCGSLSASRGPGQKVFSFSFFLGKYDEVKEDELCKLRSSSNGYLAGIKKNLRTVRAFYPGYTMRVYHNAPLVEKCPIRDEMCDLFCQSDETLDLCNVKKVESFPNLEKSFGMLWRFAPMADDFVDEWHSRDLDALMIKREVDAVNQWRATSYGFHIMRDHPYHGTNILGGMFGVRQDTEERKRQRLDEFSRMLETFGNQWRKGLDQLALSQVVSPHAAKDSLVHDSYLCNKGFIRGTLAAPWPTQRLSGPNFSAPNSTNFVGNTGSGVITSVCPEECRPKDHKDWLLC